MSNKHSRESNADSFTVKKGAATIGRIIRDTKPIAPWLIFSALISLISVAMTLIAPELMGKLTNRIYDFWSGGTEIVKSDFIKGCIILASVYLLSAVCSTSQMLIMNNIVSRHFTCALRIRMSDKIKRLSVKFVDDTPSGEIISRMTHDVSVMGNTIHNFFNMIIEGVIKLVGIVAIVFTLQPVLAIFVVTLVPLSMYLSIVISNRSTKYFKKSREINGHVYALTEEDYTGFATMKAFNLESHQNARHAKLCDDYTEFSRKGIFGTSIVQPIVTMMNNISYIAICLIGGYFAVTSRLSVGDIVAFVLYAKLLAGPLESIANGVSMIQSTIASAGRVYEMLDEDELTPPCATEVPSGKGEVDFEHVFFSYTKDKPLITDLNLHVNPGQKIAIVGPTGGGKTTIVNLLMRFYDVDSGRILVDGADITRMERGELRNVFSMVLQDTWLFSGTIYENIAYGKDDATREEVFEAAKQAHIDYFIDTLPNGYDTMINEESSNISGGQKQLLTIARAYLANRPVLILDEATSNVDTRTEILIQHTMDELMKGRTSFVIAHRLSTIVDADMILVIDNGKVVEQGTHEDLLSKRGFYAKIYNSQYALLK